MSNRIKLSLVPQEDPEASLVLPKVELASSYAKQNLELIRTLREIESNYRQLLLSSPQSVGLLLGLLDSFDSGKISATDLFARQGAEKTLDSTGRYVKAERKTPSSTRLVKLSQHLTSMRSYFENLADNLLLIGNAPANEQRKSEYLEHWQQQLVGADLSMLSYRRLADALSDRYVTCLSQSSESTRSLQQQLRDAFPLFSSDLVAIDVLDRRLAAQVDKIVRLNDGLVIKISGRHRKSGVSQEDLLQVGRIALLDAIEAFDPALEFSFSTLAGFKISARMGRLAQQEDTRPLRLPGHVHQSLTALRRAEERRSPKGEPLSEQEIIDSTRLSEASIGFLRALKARSSLPLQSAKYSQGDDEVTLADQIADPLAADPSQGVEALDSQAKLNLALLKLSDKQRAVIIMRFVEDKTLQQVADLLGVSRERVRQIEKRSLERLQRSGLAGVLRELT